MKEDIDVTAMGQFQKDFKFKSLPSIDFIISEEFNDMEEGKKDSLLLMLPEVIEELVQISSSRVLILQHFKTQSRVFSNRGRMMQPWES